MELERLEVRRGDVVIAGARRGARRGPLVVLLHAGVADRRGWAATAERLAGLGLDVVAYDRRGFGETPYDGPGGATHLDDLVGVLDAVAADRPAWLVGNSMGGALAIDAALEHPARVAGLVLIAPAVTGAPEPTAADLDPATADLGERVEAAEAAGDLDALNRLEVRLWLDGPSQPEGRVGGAARALALDMNAVALGSGAPEDAGAADTRAWERLGELRAPVVVAWGEHDVPFAVERSRAVADRVPGARAEVLAGTAHLPALERPDAVAGMIAAVVRGG